MADRRHPSRDRRAVERVSDTRVREGMIQIRFWIRIVMGMFAVLIVGRLGYGFYRGVHYLPSGIFDATFLSIYVSSIFHYDRAIGIFLQNETINSFEVTVDRQRNIWMIFSILGFLYAVVTLALKL